VPAGGLQRSSIARGGAWFRRSSFASLEAILIDALLRAHCPRVRLGFREAEVRAVLATLRQDAALGGASLQQLLREALARIRLRPLR